MTAQPVDYLSIWDYAAVNEPRHNSGASLFESYNRDEAMELQRNICGSGVSRWRCVPLTVGPLPLSHDILFTRRHFRFIILTGGSVPESNVLL